MTPNRGSDRQHFPYSVSPCLRVPILLLLLLCIAGCASKQRVPLPAYPDFVAARQQTVPDAVIEIYGRYALSASRGTFRAGFNMLVQPGKAAYIELMDAKGGLQYAVSLSKEQIGMLWGPERQYIEEQASVENLNKIAGLSLQPDDLLMLICGYGLDFPQWQPSKTEKSGWILTRDPFTAKLDMGTEIARVRINGKNSEVRTKYEDYKMIDNRSIPQRIVFEVPAQKITIELSIQKFLLRDEPASPDLFSLQLPKEARHLQLADLYHGEPLLLQH